MLAEAGQPAWQRQEEMVAEFLFVNASTVTIAGTVSSDGVNGGTPAGNATGSGGGAGGSVVTKANTATLGSSLVTASGGLGDTTNYDGGNGGVGRIRVDSGSSTGTTSPSAYTSGSTDATLFASRTDTGDLLGLDANGTLQFVVRSTGSVGIGTTAPGAKLDVNGNINVAAGSYYKYNSENFAMAQTALANYYSGNAGNLTGTGTDNSAFGRVALGLNTGGQYNAAFGDATLYNNLGGSFNAGFGATALQANTSGSNNTAVGYAALYSLTGSYSNNTAIGYFAGRYYNGTTGALTQVTNSTFLGYGASALNGTGDTNETVIGYNAIGLGSNTVVLGNSSVVTTQLQGNVGIGTVSPSSKLDVTTAGLGTTQTTSSGLALVNTTAAAAGAQQISPAIRFSGFGWKTDATAASQAVDFRAFVTPVQGTANPTGYLGFGSSINGGAYSDNQLVITTSGNVGIGTTAPTTALHLGTNAETHTLDTGDALISSDLELDGILYLDGATISNSAGTATILSRQLQPQPPIPFLLQIGSLKIPLIWDRLL